MNKAIISAPFGCYLTLPGVTSTRGSYTYNRRPGAIYGALTRIHFTKDGVINKMGLKNPGICSQDFNKHPDAIWSIAGFDVKSWTHVMNVVSFNATVELNASCPNAEQTMSVNDWSHIFYRAKREFQQVIVKLPADFKKASMLYILAKNEGITHFHCCNTIKTDKGGLSGRAIQEYSLPIIEHIKRDPDIKAIGGGGIYSAADVRRYRDAGADYFALGTICFMPWKMPSVLKEINKA